MLTFLVIVAVLAVIVGVLAGPSKPQARPRTAEQKVEEEPLSLAQDDPVEALRRYGTPETAEQLRAQGVDLAGLGYRPPSES